MSSMKEMMVREYISNINFKVDDWRLPVIKEDLRKMLGEEPGIDIVYKKDVMVNEFTGEAKEFKDVDRVHVIFTDTNDRFKRIEVVVGDNIL